MSNDYGKWLVKVTLVSLSSLHQLYQSYHGDITTATSSWLLSLSDYDGAMMDNMKDVCVCRP